MKARIIGPAILLFLSSGVATAFSSLRPSGVARSASSTSSSTTLYENVAASLLSGDTGGGDDRRSSSTDTRSKKRPRISRPERKALERAQKKRRQHRKHNFAELEPFLRSPHAQDEGRYDLHSTEVASLNEQSTADHVIRAIKRAQNRHDVHDIRAIERFLLEQTDASFAYGYKGSLLSRLAVAALHMPHEADMQHHALAKKAMQVRRTEFRSSMLPFESAALLRGLLRVHNVTDAMELLEDELSLPLPGTDLAQPGPRDRLLHRASSLASIASRHFYEGEPSRAVLACQKLAALATPVREAGLTAADLKLPWARLLRGASQCEAGRRNGTVTPCLGVEVDNMPCNVVYAVLNAMSVLPSDNSDKVYELLSNALVRRVVFVTGAVSMDTCPPADRGEAVFIGRSNVGKSSLVNMITNRKSLAYTSKRPGKTQQFNFFAVNDKPGRDKEIRYGDVVEGEKDADSFYIVDLPGYGYAKVPQQVREQWLELMHDYISQRPTLRVLFHLMDARHGPTQEDEQIMQQVSEYLPEYAKYVVVLTKTDKNVKDVSKNAGKVSNDVMDRVREAMKANGVGSAPVILSSAQTKLGRDDCWKFLRLAAEA